MRIRIFAILVLGGIVMSSCSVTRRMTDDEYLLTRNRIDITYEDNLPRSERANKEEISEYIRQRPNKRLFGIPFFLHLYNLSPRDKQNWTKRAGEEPVVYDPAQTERTIDALSIYMRGHGFFDSSVEAIADTLRNRKIQMEYRINAGQPARIGTIGYDFQDAFVEPIIREDSSATLIHTGNVFDVDRLQEERQRITTSLKNQGFYNFSVNNIGFSADTVTTPGTVNLVMRVRQRAAGFDERERPVMENNTVYRIRNIYVQPDYTASTGLSEPTTLLPLDTLEYRGVNILYHRTLDIRPDVLMRAINLYPNDIYNAREVNRAYDNLMKLNCFRTASIVFTELPDSLSGLITFIGDESDSGNYTQERYLDCTIQCTPGLRQSYSIDLEGTSTSTYYGLLTTLGYQNRNLLKGAESIDFSITAGYEFMRVPGRKNSIELGGTVGVNFPRFITPVRVDRYNRLQNVRTRVELSVNYQDRPFYRRTLTSANWGYSWSNNRYSSFSLRPIDISVINMGDLDTTSSFYQKVLAKNRYLLESFKSQMIAGISGSYTYNNSTKNPNGNTFRLRLNAETNGNLLNTVVPWFSDKYTSTDEETGEQESYYRLFGIRYAQYVRGDLDMSYKFALGLKTAVAARFYIGAGHTYGNSNSMPYERQFYAGGPNSMRGWQVRTLGPGSTLGDEYDTDESTGETTSDVTYPSRVGNFKLEANLEFRFPVYKFLNGAAFLDMGNIWMIGSRQEGVEPESYFRFNRFYDQLGLNTGLGARFDFGFFLFRVDWGIRLHNPNKPVGEKWMSGFTLRQTAFSFSVGYPF